jgi:hypothetical protein
MIVVLIVSGLPWLGPAKPDDPVFKEGWTITLPSGRRSSMPSGNMPSEANDKADEAESEGDKTKEQRTQGLSRLSLVVFD